MGKKKKTDIEFIEVLADLQYGTNEERANALGITERAFYSRLRDNPDLIERGQEQARMWVKTETPAIYKKTIALAKRGDMVAADKIFRITGAYNDRVNVEHSGNVVAELKSKMTDEEFAELAKRTADRISKEK